MVSDAGNSASKAQFNYSPPSTEDDGNITRETEYPNYAKKNPKAMRLAGRRNEEPRLLLTSKGYLTQEENQKIL
ncbi:hypothetical protein OCU04_002566 [Sclerotinia nivalis]|uniref:Uncharacterized protein n=1 Tax=Sclerotinia nivalis TaxID=352851 RepID=A0A9X0DP72_9HELO|nr:hypothetical protein OCU04_002566 [Sclerotinia nivalis]